MIGDPVPRVQGTRVPVSTAAPGARPAF